MSMMAGAGTSTSAKELFLLADLLRDDKKLRKKVSDLQEAQAAYEASRAKSEQSAKKVQTRIAKAEASEKRAEKLLEEAEARRAEAVLTEEAVKERAAALDVRENEVTASLKDLKEKRKAWDAEETSLRSKIRKSLAQAESDRANASELLVQAHAMRDEWTDKEARMKEILHG